MNSVISYDVQINNGRTVNFNRLIEHIRQRMRERELAKDEQQRRKSYSIIHYIEHIKRYIDDNPLVGRILFQYYTTVKDFTSQNNRELQSNIDFDKKKSAINLEEKSSVDSLSMIGYDAQSKSNLSKISLELSQTIGINRIPIVKSKTHFIQPNQPTHQSSGLMTKSTMSAINKAPHQRTEHDIEILEHLLNRCENLRHLPTNVRRYAARSVLFLTYQPSTMLTRQNHPSFLVYILVYGHRLNIGDVYDDDSLQLINYYHLNGLMTDETCHCNLIGFFSRDTKAYGNYLSDLMKQSLLEQFQMQSIFASIHWRNDILNYFLKFSNYKQYSKDEVIYGNQNNEHENLYFILHGQIAFIRLLDVPSLLLKHPEYSHLYQQLHEETAKTSIIKQFNTSVITSNGPLSSTLLIDTNLEQRNNFKNKNENSKVKRTWRFVEIFRLSNGQYFGFESTTKHAWYLTQSIVDIISIPKKNFKEFGVFAPIVLEKLRQDYLDIFPNDTFIRHLYFKYIQTNKFNDKQFSTIHFTDRKQFSTINNRTHEHSNWIPEQHILSMKYIFNVQIK